MTSCIPQLSFSFYRHRAILHWMHWTGRDRPDFAGGAIYDWATIGPKLRMESYPALPSPRALLAVSETDFCARVFGGNFKSWFRCGCEPMRILSFGESTFGDEHAKLVRRYAPYPSGDTP